MCLSNQLMEDIELQSQRAQSRHTASNSGQQDPSDRQQPGRDDNRSEHAPKHRDTSATYWKLYGIEAKIYDKNFIETLMGNTNSMVILNTLFSAIVAAFIIEIYKTLSPTNSQPIVTIPQSSAIRINIVLFISFFLSIMSAVACALIQQWCYEYLKSAYPKAAPHERGRVRTYLFQGLHVFSMRRFMYGTHALLHISVILFFWAIGEYFHSVNRVFGHIIRATLISSAGIYALLSFSPLILSNSPYNTPMTPFLRSASIVLRIVFRLPWWFLQLFRRQPLPLMRPPYYSGIHFDHEHFISIKANEQARKLEPYAMKWLFTENDFSDSDMDKFLESLPGYMSSSHTKTDLLNEYLTADHVLTRIREHFITCATSVELSDEASVARVSSCIQGLRHIFQYSRRHHKKSSNQDKLIEALRSQQKYDEGFMKDFQELSKKEDPTIALRASCVRALAVQNLIFQLGSRDTNIFPLSLIPFYKFCFPSDRRDILRRLVDSPTLCGPEIEGLWIRFLRDGPLANLIILAKAVREKNDAPFSGLSFCWKTFDILLTQFGTTNSDATSDLHPPAQNDFDKFHAAIREHVNSDEMGFRMTPLLEILNIVDRGRRLLTVFSSRPKYHSRASVVFGKDYLRDSDLLEAFAHCLPDFIAKNSSKACELMEKVVRFDDLWSNLQTILQITERPIWSTSDKSRVFECCCIVLDVAFLALEGSQQVDWRAPEFGSLWQQFESFITHGFQGAFMSRAASFRFGVIKARFCKALLSQFCDDITRKKVLSFRSQWDVASLAKLIHYLGLRYEDRDDANFWNFYFNGGHIGAEFTSRAVKMVKAITSDGRLLIFCQLGHLAASTIPYCQSGLERKDIEKVFDFQEKLIVEQQSTLKCVSDTVWKDLNQLKGQVEGLTGAISGDTGNTGNAGKKRELLQSLLHKIDDPRLKAPMRDGGGLSSGTPTSEGEYESESSDSYALSSPQHSLHDGTIVLLNPIL